MVYSLGRRRRRVNSRAEPSPACLLPEEGQIKRRPDDTTQGTLGVGTEVSATFVSKGTLPACPVPSSVLVAWRAVEGGEVTTSFHGITEIWYVLISVPHFGEGGEGGDEPVRVVLVQYLLGQYDLVDGADFGAC